MSVPTFNPDAIAAAEASARYTHAVVHATTPIPTHAKVSKHHSAYWRTAEADLRALASVPVMLKSPRRFGDSQLSFADQPPSPRMLPRIALPANVPSMPPRTAGTTELAQLRALETWLRNDVAPLPRSAPERLQSFRYAFDELISQLPAHGPLLAQVKLEYEHALRVAAGQKGANSLPKSEPPRPAGSSQATARPLETLHPLQMPAAYYEAQWRSCKDELSLVKSQRQRLRRMVRRLRTGAVEVIQRLHTAGAEPGSEHATVAGPAVADLAELADTDDEVEPNTDRALARSQQVVSAQTEDAVEVESNRMRDRLLVTEIRLVSAGRLAQRAAQGSMSARVKLEEEIAMSATLGDVMSTSLGDGEVGGQRIASLEALLKSVREQEAMVADMVQLLREPGTLDKATLRKLSSNAANAYAS